MINLLDYPLLIFVTSTVALSISTWIGQTLRRHQTLEEDGRQYYGIVTGATLGLLSLVIGFTFSMSVNRYDARKSYEAQEANAIGTEYFRIDLLPGIDKKSTRALLSNYLDQRIHFYVTRDETKLAAIEHETARLQSVMWSSVEEAAAREPNGVTSLAVSGMNNVLDLEGFTQAAWRNRLPVQAWELLAAIAIGGNILVGYGARLRVQSAAYLVVLPIALSVALFLIADIDSPRGGLIHIEPGNLESLSHAIRALSQQSSVHVPGN